MHSIRSVYREGLGVVGACDCMHAWGPSAQRRLVHACMVRTCWVGDPKHPAWQVGHMQALALICGEVHGLDNGGWVAPCTQPVWIYNWGKYMRQCLNMSIYSIVYTLRFGRNNPSWHAESKTAEGCWPVTCMDEARTLCLDEGGQFPCTGVFGWGGQFPCTGLVGSVLYACLDEGGSPPVRAWLVQCYMRVRVFGWGGQFPCTGLVGCWA